LVKTKGLDRTVKKWQDKVAGATGDYTAGIENPKADWGTETLKAEPRYKEGVTRAAAEGRFGKGVNKAGTEKWKKNALSKGPGRWSDGVSKAEPEYREGMSEVISTIEGITLPPKGPKGDARNYDRVKAIGDALHRKAIGK
jgi:hypothetical protein